MATVETAVALSAANVGVDVGALRLLHPTSLEVRTGELVALIGPSGSGKTTLLRTLAGVTAATQGTVTLGGDPIIERMTDVGYLPYDDTLHDVLTVREALTYTAALRLSRELGASDRAARVDEVVTELRLGDRIDTMIQDLSGGERKRVACAQELIGRPSTLLLDEPATGLDPGLERRLMEILRRLADHGRGVVVVTHATSSLALCDRVAVMGHGGHLRHLGTPAEVLEHFQVTAYDEIYEALEEERVRSGSQAGPTAAPAFAPPAPLRMRAPLQRPFAFQVGVLAERYARCLTREPRTLGLLLAQAPVIGVCIGLVLPRDVLGQSDLAPYYGVLLCFLLLTASIWIGVISSCREIVKENSILRREAAAGVRVDSYVAAKLAVLLPLALVQVLMLVGTVIILQPLHRPPTTYLEVAALCVLAAWASVGMGLAVSAYARTADQASSSIPLLLIPQLLFAGAIIPTGIMQVPIRAIAQLTYARWALGGLGGAMGLGDRLSQEVASVAGYDRNFFSLSPGTAAVAMAFFGLLMLLVTARAIDRRTLE